MRVKLVAALGVLLAGLATLLLRGDAPPPVARGDPLAAPERPPGETVLSTPTPGTARSAPPAQPERGPGEPIPAAVPAPSPNALLFESGPPDPIETGPCQLLVLLLDLATGTPVASSVTLWRLDAPESIHWTRGDQAQARVDVPAEEHTFEGLAEGRYRLVCHDERAEAPDPQGFVVSGPSTRVTLYLDLPVPRPAFALLFDEDGTRLTRAAVSNAGRRGGHVTVGPRPWVAARQRKRSDDSLGSGGAGAGFFGTYTNHRTWRERVADAAGLIHLGDFPGDRRDERTRHVVELRLEDGRRASVEVHGAHGDGPVYVVVFAHPTAALDAIVLPDGRDGRAIADRVDVRGGSLLLADAVTQRPWREAPIQVRIDEGQQESWEFDYTLDDLPLEPFRLVR